jgi:hypothetical protein
MRKKKKKPLTDLIYIADTKDVHNATEMPSTLLEKSIMRWARTAKMDISKLRCGPQGTELVMVE